MFSGTDDDDDFSVGGRSSLFSNERSNLANLFGDAPQQRADQSLTYTAPKQPRKNTVTSADEGKKKTTPPSAVLQAATVHCYKYVNGQYNNIGKVGAAFLGSAASGEYRILLYVTQQKPVANATISKDFKFEVLPSRYARFYDDTQSLYNIVFDSQDVLDKFAKQAVLAIAQVSQPLSSVLVQDQEVGDGADALEDGDAAEMKYTGWVFAAGQLGQVIDTNMNKEKALVVKIGKGKVIKGWEEGLLGMKVKGRRMLVIPPELGYGEQGVPQRIPANATLAFEVHLLRMRKASAVQSQPALPAISQSEPVVEQPPPVEKSLPVPEATDVRTRTKSMNEQIEAGDKSSGQDSSLKNRMAKLGTAMLPMPSFNPPQAAAHLDPEPERPASVHSLAAERQPEVVTDHQYNPWTSGAPHQPQPVRQAPTQSAFQPINQMMTPSPTPSQMAAHQMMSREPAQSHMANYQMWLMAQQQQAMQAGQPQPWAMHTQNMAAGGHPSAQFGVSVPGTPAPSLAASDNSGEVLKKLDGLSEQIQSLQSPTSNIPNMDTRVLLENLTKIIKDNERLKGEVSVKGKKIEEQNDKISSLLQDSQRHVEQSNQLLEQRNYSYKNTAAQSQAKVLELEQEKVELTTKLSTVMSQLSSTQMSLTQLKKSEQELKEQVSVLAEKEVEVKATADSLKSERVKRREAEGRLTSLDDEIVELKETVASLNKALADRKQKAAEERERVKQELSELQRQQEQELSSLKERYQERHSSESTKRIADLEEQLEAKWKSKMADAVSATRKEGDRKVAEVKEEKEAIHGQAMKLKEKLLALKELYDENLEELQRCQTEVEELSPWKEKFNKLKEYTRSLKETYDEQVQELEETIDNIRQKMRTAFTTLVGQFDAEEDYNGADIKQAIQAAIKGQKPTKLQPVIKSSVASTTGGLGIENVIKEPSTDAAVAHKLGDRGIENVVREPKIESDHAHQLGDRGIENIPAEGNVDPTTAYKLGDRGIENVLKEEKVEPTVAHKLGTTSEDKTKPTTAHKLGDKGIENTPKEEKVEPSVAQKLGNASEDKTTPTTADKLGDKGIENTPKEDKVEPSVAQKLGNAPEGETTPTTAHKLGDKGIENTPKEDKVEPSVAQKLGNTPDDKTTPTTTHKLGDKGIENTPKEDKIEPSIAQKLGNTPEDKTTPTTAHKLGDKGIENVPKEGKVEATTAHKLGDKGIENVPKEGKVEATTAHKLGDKGIENVPKEGKVEATTAHKLGDKGIENVPKEGKVEATTAHKLGDKGIENVPKEGKVEATTAHKLGDKGIENVPKEGKVEASTAHKLGDKGIENVPKEGKVETSTAHKLGDKGIENVPKEGKVEATTAHKLGDKGIENVPKEDKTKQAVAHKLGDKGIENTVKEKKTIPSKVVTTGGNLFDSDSDDDFVKELTTPKTRPSPPLNEQPPPLFGDDEQDEKDLDWLS